jgi:hypothetical protein
METGVWLGLSVGGVIGVICGLWQAWDMRGGASNAPGTARMLSSVLRLTFLMVALLAAYRYAGAHKLALVGGVVVTYTAIFVWRMRQQLAKKK